MRLIDADAMKADLLTVDPRYETMIHWCLTVLDAQPTVGERKRGEWIFHETENDRYDDVICPFCRKSYTVDAYRIDDIGFTAEDFNFCPNCGADMRGEQHEAD